MMISVHALGVWFSVFGSYVHTTIRYYYLRKSIKQGFPLRTSEACIKRAKAWDASSDDITQLGTNCDVVDSIWQPVHTLFYVQPTCSQGKPGNKANQTTRLTRPQGKASFYACITRPQEKAWERGYGLIGTRLTVPVAVAPGKCSPTPCVLNSEVSLLLFDHCTFMYLYSKNK